MARFNFEPYPTVTPAGAPSNDYEHIPAATPEAFGGLIAGAEQKLGQGVEAAGEAGLSYATARQHLNNEVNDNDTLTWFAQQGTARTEKFKQLEGRSAVDGLPDFNSDLGDLRKQAMKDKSLTSQAALSRGVASLMDRYTFAASNHAATQERNWHDKSAIDGAKTYGDQFVFDVQNGTWDHANQSLKSSNEAIATLWRQRNPSLDPESKGVIDQEVKKNQGAIVKNAVENLAANGDPRTAQAVFDKYRSGMDAGSVLAVTSHLRGLNAQLDGRQVADEETGRTPRGAPPAPIDKVPASFVGAIKREEGFDARPRWDVKQWTVGYGTKATGPDERPDQATLERRFQGEVSKASKIVDAVNPNLDPGTHAALTSLTYNTGDGWTRAGLGERVRAGDLQGAQQKFLEYANVAGAPNAAVAERRWREAQWFGRAEAPGGGPSMDKGQVYDRVLARTAHDPLMQNAAVARMNQIFSVERTEQTQNKVLFAQRYADTTAEAKANGTVTNPLTENDFMALPNMSFEQRQQEWHTYQDGVTLGTELHAAASMSPEDRDRITPQMPAPGPGYERALKQRDAFLQGLEEFKKERTADPAGYAIARLPDAKAAYQGMAQTEQDSKANDDQKRAARANFAAVMRDEQARVGVDPAEVRLLTKDSADALNKRFTAVADSDDAQARTGLVAGIQHEAALWGDNWPMVMRQLAPTTQPVVRAIAAGADPVAMARLLSVPKDENPAKILKEQNETTFKKLSESLNDAFAPFRGTMVGRQMDRDYGAYYGLGEKLAALYVRDGEDAKAAGEKAFNALIGNRYDFRDTWRMPKSTGVAADDVQAGTQALRTGIEAAARSGSNPLGIAPAINDIGLANNHFDSLEKFSRDGRFVTSPDNSGLNLVYGNNFVRSSAGKPIFFSWADLAARGRGSAEERRLGFEKGVVGGAVAP